MSVRTNRRGCGPDKIKAIKGQRRVTKKKRKEKEEKCAISSLETIDSMPCASNQYDTLFIFCNSIFVTHISDYSFNVFVIENNR